MTDFSFHDVLSKHPAVAAIAGPNGAGKTSFFRSYLAQTGLPFINADVLAATLSMDPYEAAKQAEALRRAMLARRESFVFETVFSDPVGDKVALLEDAARLGYTVLLVYIGLADAEQSIDRVKIRVSRGGHNVPAEKLRSRYPRTLENLRRAIERLPLVVVYDNSKLNVPPRRIAIFENGVRLEMREPIPTWLNLAIS